jgi:tetraacyldisaccharide 4'-kinase
MKPPAFWRHGGVPPLPLRALSWIYAAATARRLARPGWKAGVPVICCGNPGAGGSGKTPLALDIAERLQARGHAPAFLTRGHGGTLNGPRRVDPSRHSSAEVGDEALLLAGLAPTFIGADRAASARLAISDGADVLVLDDGLQNPSLAKTLSVMVIDGGAGFGNGHVIPAGPLREKVATAAHRCQAAVMIGDDATGAGALLPASLRMLRARIVPQADDVAALPDRVVAFAGIGRPQKFFETLRDAGHAPLEALEFADHHPYTTGELDRLQHVAQSRGAALVTTAKDLMRIPPSRRGAFKAVRIRLEWSDPTEIEALLDWALRR